MPARVLLQDFTGVPCVVDLAAMRDGIVALGGDPAEGQPAAAGGAGHRPLGAGRSLRHRPTRWSSTPTSNTTATASATCSCAGARPRSATSASCRPRPASCTRSTSSTSRASSAATTSTARPIAYPDTVFGTDSHTTMVNGLGVVGWGVGGIEAEAAMLGQPSSMLIPPVRRLPADGPAARRRDRHRPGADDHRSAAQAGRGRQVRRVLRPRPGAPDDRRSRHARQHVPRVRRHRRDLPDRRHDARLPAPHRPRRRRRSRWSRPTRKAQGLFRTDATPDAAYSETLELDLGDGRAEPGRSAPSAGSRAAVEGQGVVCRRARRAEEGREESPRPAAARRWPTATQLEHGSVVIAAITSCTNTSNPSVMIGAGLVAKKAVEQGPARASRG